MPRVSKYQRIEALLNAPLAHQLRRWRDAKVSVPAMARLLTQETGVSISAEGVRLWLRALDTDTAA